MIPTPPVRLRDRLAARILAALHDDDARRELAALAAGTPIPPGWPEDGPGAAAMARARARSAVRALATRDIETPGDPLEAALADGAALFDAGLFFEVHELLEPLWQAASGDTREALQGLIQVAVGYQHRANGNLAGARALLAEGARRVQGRRIGDLALDAFAGRVAASLQDLENLTEAAIPPFPRSRHRRATT